MFKSKLYFLIAVFFLFGIAANTNAAVMEIGLASDGAGNDFGIHYDSEQELIFLGPSFDLGTMDWWDSKNWAENVVPGYSISLFGSYSIEWAEGSAWILPSLWQQSDLYENAVASGYVEGNDKFYVWTERPWGDDSEEAEWVVWWPWTNWYDKKPEIKTKDDVAFAFAMRSGTVVPLPTAIWLLGSGLAAFAMIRRKK